MNKSYYRYRNIYSNNVFIWALLIYVSVIVLFCTIWFWSDSDKINYKNYKKYETVFDTKLKSIVDEINKYNSEYQENKLTQEQIIEYYNAYSDALDELYDEFSWEEGDIVTKELYTTKKQIIINYAQLCSEKAKALEQGVLLNENEYLNYITTLIDHYNIKDKLQRERFKLPF